MTTTTLDAALKAVQDIVSRVSGIRAAPEYATDKVPPGMWSMAFPQSGVYTVAPGQAMMGLHVIGLYVYTPRVDLPKTLRQIIPVGDKIALALVGAPTLLDTVTTTGDLSYSFNMSLNVGTASAPAYVAGWTFTLSGVKIINTALVMS